MSQPRTVPSALLLKSVVGDDGDANASALTWPAAEHRGPAHAQLGSCFTAPPAAPSAARRTVVPCEVHVVLYGRGASFIQLDLRCRYVRRQQVMRHLPTRQSARVKHEGRLTVANLVIRQRRGEEIAIGAASRAYEDASRQTRLQSWAVPVRQLAQRREMIASGSPRRKVKDVALVVRRAVRAHNRLGKGEPANETAERALRRFSHDTFGTLRELRLTRTGARLSVPEEGGSTAGCGATCPAAASIVGGAAGSVRGGAGSGQQVRHTSLETTS